MNKKRIVLYSCIASVLILAVLVTSIVVTNATKPKYIKICSLSYGDVSNPTQLSSVQVLRLTTSDSNIQEYEANIESTNKSYITALWDTALRDGDTFRVPYTKNESPMIDSHIGDYIITNNGGNYLKITVSEITTDYLLVAIIDNRTIKIKTNTLSETITPDYYSIEHFIY